MTEVPRIPLFGYSDVFGWPLDSESGRGRFFNKLHDAIECPFCAIQMRKVDALSGKCTPSDYVVICDVCGFWFGRGMSEWYGGPKHLRGVVGLLSYMPLDDPAIPTDELLAFLNRESKWLTNVDPFKAEDLVCRLLHDAYGWEVRHVGGRRDHGIDAYATLAGRRKAIVQIKWRQDPRKAESVSTVRELAGTLVAQGVPSGILVTTRHTLSAQAKEEAHNVERRVLLGLGRLAIEWRTYSDILDMLEIAAQRIDAKKTVPFERRDHGEFYIFDGGGIWDPQWTHIASEDERSRLRTGDPYALLGERLA